MSAVTNAGVNILNKIMKFCTVNPAAAYRYYHQDICVEKLI